MTFGRPLGKQPRDPETTHAAPPRKRAFLFSKSNLGQSTAPAQAPVLPKRPPILTAASTSAASSSGAAQIAARRATEANRSQPLPSGGQDMDSEFEGGASSTGGSSAPPPQPPPRMRGRLKQNYSFWKTFVRSQLVLSWILAGFPLKWADGPPAPVWLANHSSAYEHTGFVDSAIADLVATGAAEPVDVQPTCVLPLGVVPKKGTSKYRLIFDARYINEHLVVPSFQYEGLSALPEILQPNDFLFTVDLKSGYHHIDMHPDAWPYLGFEWRGQFFRFVQLPFGLAPACWVFTKVTRELQQYWRADGHRCAQYIDDGLHAHQDRSALSQWQARVLSDLDNCGFLVSTDKCSLEPEHRKEFLGATVDTEAGRMWVPEGKRVAARARVASALAAYQAHETVRVRDIASIAGQLLSMSYSFGKIAVLMTRRLGAWVASHTANLPPSAFDRHHRLDASSAAELEFWLTAWDRFDGARPLWRPPHMLSVTINTDAAGRSDYHFGGWGGWTSERGELRLAAGQWTFDTAKFSSTYLELRSMLNVLEALNQGGRWDGQRILIRTDSQPARDVMAKGGSVVAAIQDVCAPLLWYCIERNIDLVLEWVPRERNALADSLSKWQDPHGWKLQPQLFAQLAARWGHEGRFAFDLFASDANFQCTPYYTFYHSPTAAGVNAFAYEWPQGPNIAWCYPPFGIISRVLAHARACGARLCLVAPYWPRAVWWPQLLQSRHLFHTAVHDVFVFAPSAKLFVVPPTRTHVTPPSPTWRTIALLLDFTTACAKPVPVPRL